jgi:hypothetical protein
MHLVGFIIRIICFRYFLIASVCGDGVVLLLLVVVVVVVVVVDPLILITSVTRGIRGGAVG